MNCSFWICFIFSCWSSNRVNSSFSFCRFSWISLDLFCFSLVFVRLLTSNIPNFHYFNRISIFIPLYHYESSFRQWNEPLNLSLKLDKAYDPLYFVVEYRVCFLYLIFFRRHAIYQILISCDIKFSLISKLYLTIYN